MEEEPPHTRPPSAQGGSLAATPGSAGQLEGDTGAGSSGGGIGGSKRRKVGAQKRLHEDTRFGEPEAGWGMWGDVVPMEVLCCRAGAAEIGLGWWVTMLCSRLWHCLARPSAQLGRASPPPAGLLPSSPT